MPIYEYECGACGAVREVLVFSSQVDVRCPACGSPRVRKLMSAASSLTGRPVTSMPGSRDTGCCGMRPGEAPNCAGPGSCCGKT